MVLKVFDFDLKVYHLDLTGVDSGLTVQSIIRVHGMQTWVGGLNLAV